MIKGRRTTPAGASGSTRFTKDRASDFARRYWWSFTAAVVGVHLLAWAVSNPQRERVHWILFTSNSPLGLVIAAAVVLGAVLAVLISHQRRLGNPDAATVMTRPRPGRDRNSKPPDGS